MPRVPRLLVSLLMVASTGAAQAPLAIPVTFDGHLFVHAMINGAPARLLYDPVDGVMLDRGYVQARPGWHRDWRAAGRRGPTMVGGAGPAQVEVTFADSVTLVLGAITRHYTQVHVIPLDSMLQEAIPGPLHGLLGTTVLHDYAVQFDFAGQRLLLHDPATLDTTGWQVMPLTMLGARAITPVTITIADTLSYTLRAAVDWGMVGPLRVTTAATNRLRLLRHAGRTRSIGAGLGGMLHSVLLDNVVVQLGAAETAPLEVELAREPSGGDANPPYDALLGLGALSRFDVIYDPTNARLLVRNGEPRTANGEQRGT